METIIRVEKKDDPYVRLDKRFIENPKLSLKAKGLLTYLLSKPDGWDTRVSDIIKKNKDQEKSVRSGLKELADRKYIKRIRVIDAVTKRVIKWQYIIFERPHTQNVKVDTIPLSQKPQVEKPHVEKPQVEKVPPNNKSFNKQTIIKVINDFNNNNKVVGMVGDEFVVVGSILHKRNWNRLEKKIHKLGWVGTQVEIYAIYNKYPKYVVAWIQKISEIKELTNPAGLLRKSLRSGVWPRDAADKRRDYMDDEYADALEN